MAEIRGSNVCTRNFLRLSELIGSAEERPRVNRRGATPAETAEEYWTRAVAIRFLDIVSSELKSRFSHEKRAHYELCALVPEVISKNASRRPEREMRAYSSASCGV